MKRVLVLLFIVTSNLSFGQARELLTRDTLSKLPGKWISDTPKILKLAPSLIKINETPYEVTLAVNPDSLRGSGSSGTVSGGSITWPSIFSSPTTGTIAGGVLTFSPPLVSQSAYTIFGRGSGTGTPSFISSLDSNWIPTLHTQAYYDARYSAKGSSSGGGLTGSGTTNFLPQFTAGTVLGSSTIEMYGTNLANLNMKWQAGGRLGWDFDKTGAYFAGIESPSATQRGLNIMAVGASGDNSIYFQTVTGTIPLTRMSIRYDGVVTVGTTASATNLFTVNGTQVINTSGNTAAINVTGSTGQLLLSGTGYNEVQGINNDLYISQGTNLKNMYFRTFTNGGVGVRMTLFSSGSLMLQNSLTHTEIASSLFTANSSTQGTLPWTRMTTTNRTAITLDSTNDGLAVYDITLHHLYINENGTWVQK